MHFCLLRNPENYFLWETTLLHSDDYNYFVGSTTSFTIISGVPIKFEEKVSRGNRDKNLPFKPISKHQKDPTLKLFLLFSREITARSRPLFPLGFCILFAGISCPALPSPAFEAL